MLSKLSSLARSGLLALGVIGGLTISATAAPAGMASSPVLDSASAVVPVQGDGRYSSCIRSGSCVGGRGGPFLNAQSGRQWNGNREWRGNRHWDGNRHWRGDRRDWRRYNRRHYRPYYRPYYGGSGIYFDFSVPSYRYYEPRRYYAPQRVYRGGGSAHVQWCYNRYRSYRSWDNTYQPYNGPRRQCWSPYS